MSDPKELRDAYERVREENAALRDKLRGYTLDSVGVPEKARPAVIRALGDDVDWDDAASVTELLTESGLSFAGKEESKGGPPEPSPEQMQERESQQRIDALRNAGTPPSAQPPSTKDQIAEADAKGDLNAQMGLRARQMLEVAGLQP